MTNIQHNNYNKLIDFRKWSGCEVQQNISLGMVREITLQTYYHRPIQKALEIRNAHFLKSLFQALWMNSFWTFVVSVRFAIRTC